MIGKAQKRKRYHRVTAARQRRAYCNAKWDNWRRCCWGRDTAALTALFERQVLQQV
jgi:hypothetical protein